MLVFKLLWSNQQAAESIANYTQNVFSGYGTMSAKRGVKDWEIHCFCELEIEQCLDIAKKIALSGAVICDLNNRLYNF